jgi:hypothetical protein
MENALNFGESCSFKAELGTRPINVHPNYERYKLAHSLMVIDVKKNLS